LPTTPPFLITLIAIFVLLAVVNVLGPTNYKLPFLAGQEKSFNAMSKLSQKSGSYIGVCHGAISGL